MKYSSAVGLNNRYFKDNLTFDNQEQIVLIVSTAIFEASVVFHQLTPLINP
jgi:hypothetical protein